VQWVQEAHDAGDLCWMGAKGQVDVAGAYGDGVAVNLQTASHPADMHVFKICM
jgi:hypothetical protein